MSGEAPKIVSSPLGGEVAEILRRDTKITARSYWRLYPLVVRRVEGAVVEDINGNRYIDFTSGGGFLPLGGGHPGIREIYRRFAESSAVFNINEAYSVEVVELAEELTKIAPIRGDVRILITDSGAEAFEAALKTARWHTGRQIMTGLTGSFHGSTLGAQSISWDVPVRRRGMPPAQGVIHAPYPDCPRCPMGLSYPDCGLRCLEYLEETLEAAPVEDIAAAVVQPVRRDAASPPPEYLPRLRNVCRKLGIMLLADESVAAPARSGRWFALDHWQVDADLVTVSAPLASGSPFGVLLAREDVLDLEPRAFQPEVGGGALGMMCALTTLRALRDEGLVERAERLGRGIRRVLEPLAEELGIVGGIKGKGMYLGVEVLEDGKPSRKLGQVILKECFRLGLLLRLEGKSTITITPPLNIDEELLEKGLEIIEAKLREAEEVHEKMVG